MALVIAWVALQQTILSVVVIRSFLLRLVGERERDVYNCCVTTTEKDLVFSFYPIVTSRERGWSQTVVEFLYIFSRSIGTYHLFCERGRMGAGCMAPSAA